MKLIYISQANFKDRLFLKDLVHNFKSESKAILVHDTYGDRVPETRFVTKRLSALFSEAMVYNRAFSADQRNLFAFEGEQLVMNREKIDALLDTVSLLVIGPVIKKGETSQLADPFAMLQVLRESYSTDELILFTENPMSPLATKGLRIESAQEVDKLLKAYEEEQKSLESALRLAPARILSPSNYM